MKINTKICIPICILLNSLILSYCRYSSQIQSESNQDKIKKSKSSNTLIEDEPKDLFEFDMAGQYVIYHDTRGGKNNLIGILKFNKTEYIARQLNIDSGNEVLLGFRAVGYSNGSVDCVPDKIYKGDQNDAIFLLTDLANMVSQYGQYRIKTMEDLELEDKWPEFGYTLIHSYKKWIPIIHLYETKKVGQAGDFFKLILMGRMLSESDNAFFTMNRIPLIYKTAQLELESFPNTTHFKYGLIDVPLDKNWTRYKDPNVSNPNFQGYLINKVSKRDAQVSIEVFPIQQFKLSIESIVNMGISFNTWVIPNTVTIKKIGNSYKVKLVTLDPKTLNETFMYMYYKPDSKGNVHIFHLSAFLDTYETNEKYFNQIMDSVQ